MNDLKRFLSAVLLFLFVCSSVSAFSFPEPDWGALLEEKKEMVNGTDFELYTEGGKAPFYGVKHEPSKGVYFGAVAENSKVFRNVSAYLTYFDVNSGQPDIYYPANEIIKEANAVTVVALNVSDINTVDYSVIKGQLDTLSAYGKPMIIRYANEMNVSNLGDDPERYIASFRKVADMIHSYDNFATVWSPNDLGGLDRPFSYYYPGDKYVDWIGISSYQKKYFLGDKNSDPVNDIYFMTGDYAYTTNALKPIIKFMRDNGIKKPVMISEGGVGVKNHYGENLEEFAKTRLRDMYWNVLMKYPEVKLINYFNVERPGEKEEYYISDKPYAVDVLNEAATSGAYLPSYGSDAEFVFSKAGESSVLYGKGGYVNLYTLAHIPKVHSLEVNYRIDGAWYHSSKEIPYKCRLKLENISDGVHSVEISASGLSKKYYFLKSGNVLRFIPEKSDKIRVFISGNELLSDVSPIIEDGRTMVPMRSIFEALGAEINWNDSTKTVTSKSGDREISVTIGKKSITVNGAEMPLDVAPVISGGRTLVPARAVSEGLGCSVYWNNETRVVSIEKK